MRYAAFGCSLIALWVAGLLAYVNYFSESARSHGDVVLGLSWAALAAGVAVMCVGIVRLSVGRNR